MAKTDADLILNEEGSDLLEEEGSEPSGEVEGLQESPSEEDEPEQL